MHVDRFENIGQGSKDVAKHARERQRRDDRQLKELKCGLDRLCDESHVRGTTHALLGALAGVIAYVESHEAKDLASVETWISSQQARLSQRPDDQRAAGRRDGFARASEMIATIRRG
jgi:hypothetical protein